MEVGIMIEGQNGLTWERWRRLVGAVEALGFVGLFRSDHFTNGRPPDIESLELWVSLTWLAANTQRLEFGPLVSPFSFRHPALTARMAAGLDDLSGGRLVLGLGAGWQQREHHNFGFELLEVEPRFKRFEEGLQVVTWLLQSDQPVSFEGHFYQLHDAMVLPRPQRPGGPRILIGGNGRRRTLPLAARFAAEWNAVNLSPKKFAVASGMLDDQLRAAGRQAGEVRRSMMTSTAFGRDEATVRRKSGGRDPAVLMEQGWVCGGPGAVTEQLGRLAEAGVQRVMLQWLELDDLDGLELLANTVLGQVGGSPTGLD